jgi:hypothetical protein
MDDLSQVYLIQIQQKYINKLEKLFEHCNNAICDLTRSTESEYGIIIEDLQQLCVKNSTQVYNGDNDEYKTVFNLDDLYPDITIKGHHNKACQYDLEFLEDVSWDIIVGEAEIVQVCCRKKCVLVPKDLSDIIDIYDKLLAQGRISADSIGALVKICTCR